MKRIVSLMTLLTLGSLSLTPPQANAQVTAAPSLLNFQGRLAKPDGTPVSDGTYTVTFSLWSAATGGTQLWTETDTVTAHNGAFAVLLGKTTALSASLFAGSAYLQLQIGTDAALSPRQQVASVAYAMKASTVPDGSIGATQIANGSLTASKFASNAFNGLAWLLGGNAGTNPASSFLGTTDNQPLIFKANNTEGMRLLPNGKIGIGTSSPSQMLSVAGSLVVDANAQNTGLLNQSGLANGATSYGLVLGGGGEGIASARFANSPNPFGLDFYTGYSQRLSITQGGSVGIGTTSPAYLLDVAGTARVTGFLLPTGAAAGKVLTSDANGNGTWGQITGASLGNGTITAANIASGTITGSNIASGTITAANLASGVLPASLPPSGNAGGDLTGTYPNPLLATLPGSLTKVSGNNLAVSGKLIADNLGLLVDATGLNAGALTNGSPYGLIFGATGSGEGIASARTTGSANLDGLDFYSDFIKRMSVTSGGNVGIGTAAPAYLLDVAGTAQMTGFKLPTGAGANKILISDANGVGTWQTFAFSGAAGGDLTGTYPNPSLATLASSLAKVSGGAIVNSGGNIGIGTSSPQQALSVVGGLVVDQSGQNTGSLNQNGAAGNGLNFGGGGEGIASARLSGNPNQYGLDFYTNYIKRMSITNTGTVGIGTASPQATLDVNGTVHTVGAITAAGTIYANGGANFGIDNYGYLNATSTAVDYQVLVTAPFSVFATNRILATEFDATSDERIKNRIGRSDAARDLNTLLGIEITDYTMKDTVAQGNRHFKKVIAQQVEGVYPQAVTKTTGVIPDIYQKAKIENGWVKLATNLKVGERARLITKDRAELYTVEEVGADGFRVEGLSGAQEVFVYGREVSDLRTVDYDALAMLNVSATQGLYRLLEAQQKQIDELKTKVDELSKQNTEVADLKKQLAALVELVKRAQDAPDK